MTYWVFAYGSNMHLEDLRAWFARRSRPFGTLCQARRAVLPGYQLIWNYHSVTRGGGAANVSLAENAELPGVALEVDERLLSGLDEKEGSPHIYQRRLAPIQLDSQHSVQAWVYQVTLAHTTSEMSPPTQHYLRLLIEGARSFKLPEAHLNALVNTPTCD